MNRGVEIRDLRKEFALVRWQGLRRRVSQVTAVDGITLDVPAGQSVAFIGPNGAGKSTTIKILTGILHPSSGHVKVLGLTPWVGTAKARSTHRRRVRATLSALVSPSACGYVRADRADLLTGTRRVPSDTRRSGRPLCSRSVHGYACPQAVSRTAHESGSRSESASSSESPLSRRADDRAGCRRPPGTSRPRSRVEFARRGHDLPDEPRCRRHRTRRRRAWS